MGVVSEHGCDISGTTAQRPTKAAVGARYFDTTLGLMLFWTGTAWRPSGGVVVEERTFTETAGAGTYTATVNLPAGATILDVQVHGIALWNASGACSLVVGDGAAANGFFTATDLKATDLLAGEANTIEHPGGKAGTYIASEQRVLYSAAARDVIGVVSAAGTAGTAGRTRLVVVYAMPNSVAAVKA